MRFRTYFTDQVGWWKHATVRPILAMISTISLCWCVSPSWGLVEEQKKKTSDTNAVRVALINAVIDNVNNQRVASFVPYWDLLPASAELASASEFVEPVLPTVITIHNSALIAAAKNVENPPADPIGVILDKAIENAEQKKMLAEALYVKDLKSFTKKNSDQEFQKIWPVIGSQPHNSNISLFNTISAPNLFGVIRDHHIITALLESAGTRFAITTPISKDMTPQTKAITDIAYLIEIYKIPWRKVKNEKQYFYRFAIRVQTDKPVILNFPGTTAENVNIKVGVGFRSRDGQRVVENPFTSAFGVEIAAPVTGEEKKPFENVGADLAPTDTDLILKFATGTTLNSVAASTLFQGNAHTSIFSGGLVGGGRISPIVGVNREFKGKMNPFGLLFGFAPTNSTALFVGGSVRTALVTAGVGLYGQETDKSGGGKKITTGLAGVISVDLSRVLGGKVDKKKVQVGGNAEGDLGKSSDDIANELGLILFDVTESDDSKPFSLSMRRVATFDEKGRPVAISEEDSKNLTQISFPNKTGKYLYFAPRGMYSFTKTELSIDTLPEKSNIYDLFNNNNIHISDKSHFPIGQRGQTGATLVQVVIKKRQMPKPAPIAGNS